MKLERNVNQSRLYGAIMTPEDNDHTAAMGLGGGVEPAEPIILYHGEVANN